MSAMASPFRIPEAPQASAHLVQDEPQSEDPPGCAFLHPPYARSHTLPTLPKQRVEESPLLKLAYGVTANTCVFVVSSCCNGRAQDSSATMSRR